MLFCVFLQMLMLCVRQQFGCSMIFVKFVLDVFWNFFVIMLYYVELVLDRIVGVCVKWLVLVSLCVSVIVCCRNVWILFFFFSMFLQSLMLVSFSVFGQCVIVVSMVLCCVVLCMFVWLFGMLSLISMFSDFCVVLKKWLSWLMFFVELMRQKNLKLGLDSSFVMIVMFWWLISWFVSSMCCMLL